MHKKSRIEMTFCFVNSTEKRYKQTIMPFSQKGIICSVIFHQQILLLSSSGLRPHFLLALDCSYYRSEHLVLKNDINLKGHIFM